MNMDVSDIEDSDIEDSDITCNPYKPSRKRRPK
jgi:hypothetical protein